MFNAIRNAINRVVNVNKASVGKRNMLVAIVNNSAWFNASWDNWINHVSVDDGNWKYSWNK